MSKEKIIHWCEWTCPTCGVGMDDPITNLQSMPIETPTAARQKRLNGKPLKTKTPMVQERYNQFFVPAPSPLWQRDDDNFSLDQPSPVKWVQTETTYGIDVTLCPPLGAREKNSIMNMR